MTTFNEIRKMLDRDGMLMMFGCSESLKSKYEALQWEMRNSGEKQGEVTERDGNLFQILTDIQLLLKALQADEDLESALNFYAKDIARNGGRTAEQAKQIVALIKKNMQDMTQLTDEIVKGSNSSTYARFSTLIMDTHPRTQAPKHASQMVDKASVPQTVLALREHPHLLPGFINVLNGFSLRELEQYRAEMYKQVLGDVVKAVDEVSNNKKCTQEDITCAKNKFIHAKNELLKDPLFVKLQEAITKKGGDEGKKVTIFEPEKIEDELEKPSSHSRLKGVVDRFRDHSPSPDRKARRQSSKQHIPKESSEKSPTQKPGGRN